MSPHHTDRKLGNFERWILTQALVKSDPAIAFVASLPSAHPISVPDLLAAISILLIRHPLLACTVTNPTTRTPAFKARSVDAAEVLQAGPTSATNRDSESGYTVEDALKLGLEVARSIDFETGPLWRVTLLQAGTTTSSGGEESAKLILSMAHVISDGVGTRNLFDELLALAFDPSKSAQDPAEPSRAPTLEESVDVRPSLKLIIGTVYKELLLPKLPAFLGPASLPIFPPLAPTVGVGAPHDQPTALLSASIPFSTTSALKAAGKSHGINTLHPLLHGCLIAALVLATPVDSPPSSLDTFTPISIRSPTLHPTSTGNYVAALKMQYSLTRQSSFWDLCRETATRLADPAVRAEATGLTGMMGWVPDGPPNGWVKFMEEKRDAQPSKRESVIHSNVGVIGAPEGVEVAWTHNSTAYGPRFTVSTCSTRGGALAITLTWLAGTVPEAIVQDFWTGFQISPRPIPSSIIMSTAAHHLLVGASRGIGYALAEELLKRDSKSVMYATVRDVSKATALAALGDAHPGRLVILKLDMVEEASIKEAATELSKHTQALTTIIINGGVLLGYGNIEDLSASDLLSNVNTNVVGPHNILRAFSPFLLASSDAKRSVAIISSIVGSFGSLEGLTKMVKDMFKISHAPLGSYSVSKTAVNMLGRQWADSLEPKGIAVVLIHPGSVQTEMNPGDSGITAETSVQGILSQIEKLDIASTGKGILSYDGSVLPW
ncbi:hypothetical protein RQP46_008609 [Phenoliferia psychrophenolica]